MSIGAGMERIFPPNGDIDGVAVAVAADVGEPQSSKRG